MILNIPYPGLSKTIEFLKRQAYDSADYIDQVTPGYIKDPESLFTHYRTITKYKNDPRGIEYIPTVQTLFEKNGGKGDCDCFTVLALTGLWAIGMPNLNIVLVGYNKLYPKHIYTCFYHGGTRFVFDLTNPYFDFERQKGPSGKPYKYRQELNFTMK